jgi:5-methylcytosine-specific restriction endonuclease McrA
MAFSVETKDEAYKRSGGRCECTRQHSFISDAPHHGGRCRNTFSRQGKWEAHHKLSVSHGGDDSLSNCEVLCPKCHQLTQSFGDN